MLWNVLIVIIVAASLLMGIVAPAAPASPVDDVAPIQLPTWSASGNTPSIVPLPPVQLVCGCESNGNCSC